MKKASLILVIVTLVFIAFSGGFFLGRNFNHSKVSVSSFLPTEMAETTPPTGPSEPLLVDLNSASKEDLIKLPGIGEVLAQHIIDYRTENGPFQHVSDLANVNGIGDKKLEAILEFITVGGQS